jgi:glycosyltransferase involved in cell wall biosynthesis
MDVSVVIPAYNEEESIVPLYHKLRGVLNSLKNRYEVIFIDDGSTDNTARNVINLKDENVKLIQFQKNFGKSPALSAGFENSKYPIIITIDCDLEEEVEEIPLFLEKIKTYDLIVGWRYKRKHSITKKMSSWIYNFLIRIFTGLKIHDSNCGFKAFRKEIIQHIDIYGELHRYIPALAYWQGFKVGEIKVEHYQRKFGKSKYGFTRLFKGFMDLITVKFLISYGKAPSHLFGLLGFLLSLAGMIVIATQYIIKFLYGIPIHEKPYLFMLAVLSTILGVQFISLGLLGEMIVVSPSKRGDYIIKKKIGFVDYEGCRK